MVQHVSMNHQIRSSKASLIKYIYIFTYQIRASKASLIRNIYTYTMYVIVLLLKFPISTIEYFISFIILMHIKKGSKPVKLVLRLFPWDLVPGPEETVSLLTDAATTIQYKRYKKWDIGN